MTTGSYLYAVTRGLDVDHLAGVTSLAGDPPRVVRHRDLGAVVSEVDLDEYGEDGLRRNLERLDWVEHVARTHDQVVRAVADHGPTAPLRLATIYRDEEGVRRRLEERYDELVEVLDRVSDRGEWSVKLVAEQPQDHAPAGAGAGAPSTESGAAYLLRKRNESRASADRQEAADRAAEQLHVDLAAVSVASRLLAPQDPRLTGHDGTMVLNAAYLVPLREGEAFETVVASLASALEGAGLTVECRGPWPPYSFATLEQA